MKDKPKRFILVGAGFSIPFLEYKSYTLSTSFLTKLITEKDMYGEFIQILYGQFIQTEYKSIMESSKLVYDKLLRQYEDNSLKDYPNFEHIIFVLQLLSNFSDTSTLSRKYKDYRNNEFLPDLNIANLILNDGFGEDATADSYTLQAPFEFKRKFIGQIVLDLKDEFIECGIQFKHVLFIKEFILDVVNLFTVKKGKKDLLVDYFAKSLNSYDNKIYSLNYDSLFVEVLTEVKERYGLDFNTSFNTGSQISIKGEIKPSGIFKSYLNIEKPNSLFYLHGSIFYERILNSFTVNFDQRRKPNVGNIRFKTMLMDQQNQNFINPDGGFRFNTSMITGMNKETQLSHEPYSSMFAKCRLDFHESEAIVIMGYSFSDAHINSIIKNITPSHTTYDVVDYKPNEGDDSFGKSSQEFRMNFIDLVSPSCFQPPSLYENENDEYDYNTSSYYAKMNQWKYNLDSTVATLSFNGVEEYLK